MIDFGFPCRDSYRFRLAGRYYRVGDCGVTALKILAQIYFAKANADSMYWALAVRDKVRQAEHLVARHVLSQVIEMTDDDQLRLLAVWLRGRCGGHLGTKVVANAAIRVAKDRSDAFALRKECVRALRRMSGWAQIRQLVHNETNSRLLCMASPPTGRAYQDRLAAALQNMECKTVDRPQATLWIWPEVKLRLSRPKSLHVIRQILMRIRRLVHPS